MASLKDLRKLAKGAGLKGYSKWNKAKLVEALGGDAPAPEDPVVEVAEEPEFAPIGVPNDPDQVTDIEMRGAHIASKAASNPRQSATRFGIPTEKERGGVTDKDMDIATGGKEGAVKPSKPADPPLSPSHTGQTDGIGVPTEPERGGVTDLELELSQR